MHDREEGDLYCKDEECSSFELQRSLQVVSVPFLLIFYKDIAKALVFNHAILSSVRIRTR